MNVGKITFEYILVELKGARKGRQRRACGTRRLLSDGGGGQERDQEQGGSSELAYRRQDTGSPVRAARPANAPENQSGCAVSGR